MYMTLPVTLAPDPHHAGGGTDSHRATFQPGDSRKRCRGHSDFPICGAAGRHLGGVAGDSGGGSGPTGLPSSRGSHLRGRTRRLCFVRSATSILSYFSCCRKRKTSACPTYFRARDRPETEAGEKLLFAVADEAVAAEGQDRPRKIAHLGAPRRGARRTALTARHAVAGVGNAGWRRRPTF